jgi:hypothetical protein
MKNAAAERQRKILSFSLFILSLSLSSSPGNVAVARQIVQMYYNKPDVPFFPKSIIAIASAWVFCARDICSLTKVDYFHTLV